MKNIVGNEALCEKLCLDVLNDKLSHACIIEGARGTGKHSIAKNVAAALACQNKHLSDADVPCGTCPACKKVFEGKSPDLIVIGRDDKATLGVDQIRFLKEDVVTVPNDLDFKTYIIEDADKMTEQAQNALLLTLEEPPSFVRFILLCERAELLLETIRSRAPVLRTEPIPTEQIDKYICTTDRRAAQMKLSSPKEYDELLISAKNGIGAALELLEPKAFAPVKESRALALDLISCAATSAKDTFLLLPRFSRKRDEIQKQLLYVSNAIGDLVLLKKSDDAPLSFFTDRNEAIELCDAHSMSFLYNFSQAVLDAIDAITRNANVHLTLIKLFCDANLI